MSKRGRKKRTRPASEEAKMRVRTRAVEAHVDLAFSEYEEGMLRSDGDEITREQEDRNVELFRLARLKLLHSLGIDPKDAGLDL